MTDSQEITLEIEPGCELYKEEVEPHYTRGLRRLIDFAYNGEPDALARLRQIHKLIYPERYPELSPSVERAIEFHKLMGELSKIVEPINPSDQDGRIRLKRDGQKKRSKLYKRASNSEYWNKQTTLKSLALHVYRESVWDELGIELDEKAMERDLRQYRAYCEELQQQPIVLEVVTTSGEALPYHTSTDSWKSRKRSKPKAANRKG